jgi:2-haloalkanoic acid dehalogenase type II
MTPSLPYTVLAFDVLHTLVDDSGFPRNVLWRFIEESGEKVDLDAYFREYDALGRELFDWPAIHPFVPIRELHRRRIRRLYARFGVVRHVEKDLNRLWEYMANSKVYSDAEAVLPKLARHFRLAILSNADRDDPLIRKLVGLGYDFDPILTSEEVGHYKPDRAIFDALLTKLNVPPQEVLLVGDSPKADLVGAHRVHMPVAWINRRGEKLPPGTPPPTYTFPSLHELWEFLRPALGEA